MEQFWLDPRKLKSFSIPWERFEEIEIQAIIKLLHESKGYRVNWLHMEDRAHEGGADLVCHKSGKTIAIAVKKKPRKKDLYQLLELASFGSDEKIYVYSGKATVAFYKEMRKHQNVIFWTFADLQETLFSEAFEIGFDLVVDNSLFTKEILHLFHKIRDFVIHEEKRKGTSNLALSESQELLPFLWDIKDRISVLHKGSQLMQAIFEHRELFQNLSHNNLLSLLSVGLNFLLLDSLQQFGKGLEYLLSNHRVLLSRGYWKTRTRSNWRIFQDLVPYDFLHIFQPGKVVEKCLSLQKQNQLFSEKLGTRGEIEQLSESEIIAPKLRLFSGYFGDMESIIDNLFQLISH